MKSMTDSHNLWHMVYNKLVHYTLQCPIEYHEYEWWLTIIDQPVEYIEYSIGSGSQEQSSVITMSSSNNDATHSDSRQTCHDPCHEC